MYADRAVTVKAQKIYRCRDGRTAGREHARRTVSPILPIGPKAEDQ